MVRVSGKCSIHICGYSTRERFVNSHSVIYTIDGKKSKAILILRIM